MGDHKSHVRPLSMGLLVVGVLASCAGRGAQSMNMQEVFDDKFQTALSEVRKSKSVSLVPCIPIGGERDYRYSYCFAERTGSAMKTMKELNDILSRAGFSGDSQGSADGELDGTFFLPGTPYRLNNVFNSMGISWIVYEDGRGYVAPRLGKSEDDAPYALLDPVQFAEIQVRQFLMNAQLSKQQWNSTNLYHPCDESNSKTASFCIEVDLPPAQAAQALINTYFGGDKALFDKKNLQARFSYAQEDLLELMKSQGGLSKGFASPLLFKKVANGKFEILDTSDHPAYKVIISIPTKNMPKEQVKITVVRIPISPKIKKEHEDLP